MADDASAFAALGLEPGANAAAIEQAYKRLIKQHHPDRKGGDARRAAEINRAYRELRVSRNLKDPLELNERGEENSRSLRRGWPAFAAMVLVGVAVLLLLLGPLGPSADAWRSPAVPHGVVHDDARKQDAMDQPLHYMAIIAAAHRASVFGPDPR